MSSTRKARIVVRNSKIHGRGVYAARKFKAGERIVEYRGERITWKEADRRPPSDPDDPNHTFLFSLSDGKTVIDAAAGGNVARWINHGRVFIDARRDIRAGEELNYDYALVIDERLTPSLKKQHECRCGSSNCRGTMLALKTRKKKANP